ncbi:B12-binding domain-containing radical SAM protein [Deltaproteobacteria bacterium]|nr:B12-binding domain-containing radical SAM protein [Deltaproteobacteria bacterium]
MIIFIEPISRNIGMYVPAYPLPIMEIASFVKSIIPETDIEVISIPMDYGLPLTIRGRDQVYEELIKDIGKMKPKGVGISCTAIAQAEETIHLCEMIKESDPDIFIFLGGYFPTIYFDDIFSRTSAVDLIVIGEGEVPALKIIEKLEKGEDPRDEKIPSLAWVQNGKIRVTETGKRFDLNKKAILNLELLRHPKAYDILPYSFSRGCPFRCNFCMEDYIRPLRKEIPPKTIQSDLTNLSHVCNTRDLVVCDALFKSFDLVPFLRSLGMKIHFETRCDVMQPSIIPEVADVCGTLVLGFESASYSTLRRMNKVKDRAHYERYLSNTKKIFREAVKNEIPIMVFMIGGYPGDTEEDLKESLKFTRELSKDSGKGGHVFKIGECHVYPKTKIHDLALSLPDVVFDDDGVFGQNIVRQPSKNLNFETVLEYTGEIFNLSNNTPKLQNAFLKMMPFFRLPVNALKDDMIPNICYRDNQRDVFTVHGNNLSVFRELLPGLTKKHKEGMSKDRSTRILKF